MIGTGGVFTLPGAFAAGTMSNRIHVVCSTLSIHPGGVIDVDGKGFGQNAGKGKGTFADLNAGGGGGGHGGVGGRGYWTTGGLAGNAYDILQAPVEPGSGGAGFAAEFGGAGGGAVRIEAPGGTVTINGTISANGKNGTLDGGGGSGGSIYITCDAFADSTNGLLRAHGGGSAAGGGGGGGGRIAVQYATLSNSKGIRFSTSAGPGYFGANDWWLAAGRGSVYLADATLLSETLTDHLFTDVRLTINGFGSWAVDSLTVSNCSVELASSGFQLIVTNKLTLGANGALGVGAESGTATVDVRCGSLVLSLGGALGIYSGSTAGTPDYGALVTVANDVSVGTGSWIYPYSHGSNGGSALFRLRNLSVATGGGFNANGRGYATSQGPGSGGAPSTRAPGGGHGGNGGAGQFGPGGNPYGSIPSPVAPGSGAATYNGAGGRGGGVIRIEARGNLAINGSLTAKGGGSNRGGGGAGGSINIRCNVLSGTGSLNADGGKQATNLHGDGGGGRIALDVQADDLSGAVEGAYAAYAGSANGRISVKAGTGAFYTPVASNGSFYLRKAKGLLFIVR
jgi:hypothetical protein